MHLPSTKTLQAFLATAEHLNFTKAANALNLTQGAISRQILSLEELLGVKLFFRHARGLSLTQQGLKFIPHAEDVLHRLCVAIEEVSSTPSTIKLNAPSCVTSWLLPRLMAFQDAHPDIDVELTSTIKHHLEPNFNLFDAVIMYSKAPKLPSVVSHQLFEERLTPICRPELLNDLGQQLVLDDLPRLTWLHANTEQSDWKLWLNHMDKKELFSKSNQHFSTLDQTMNAAQQGFGIAVGDITLAEQDLAMHRLIKPFDQTVLSGHSYYFLYPKQSDNPMLDTLQDWLVSGFQQSVAIEKQAMAVN
ncbi:LysR substrate-binding domain-containing protein [Vibrio ziniensis]|uniref:LysR family transcriptional regulator n=1 Tax=Vibrio ziniensis TaxID=2711221 RepID=A0A6G7CNB9_9VIBR|nr:LysR substrate-binding domain-containing protein [Vibrio ziniensis]QIH43595.1 LysR family transcriptional regulator [Vibrio ziniensis]